MTVADRLNRITRTTNRLKKYELHLEPSLKWAVGGHLEKLEAELEELADLVKTAIEAD